MGKFGLLEILTLVGSLGIFLYGMKLMSESLQKVAGEKMRSILASMTSKRVFGVLTGFLVTAVIQSSSATTVMIVSFVNAGLLSLTQSVGVIMGANIGTTVTAWIISILGFKVKMSVIAIPLIGIAFPLFFSKKTKTKNLGELIIGFSLLFLGLEYLKSSVPEIDPNSQFIQNLGNFTDLGYWSLFLFVIIGTILTVVIQSSSATMALTLVLAANGIIGFEIAAAMVLGENIGTTITANLAAMVANVSAKRAARAHFIFNMMGVTWILILFYPVIHLISWLMHSKGNPSPLDNPIAIPIALSIFHTFFNITNTLLMVWFVPLIVKVVIKLVPDKEDDEEFRLKYIDTGMLSTSEISIYQAKQEIAIYAERTSKMFEFAKKLYYSDKDEKIDKLFKKIKKYEDIVDRMEVEIANYLTKISESELSSLGSKRIKAMLEIIDDIESIGDSCYNLAQAIMRKHDNKIVFTEKINVNIEKMFKLIDSAFEEMNKNLSHEYSEIKVDKAIHIEKEINKYRNLLRDNNVINIKAKEYKYKVGITYSEIFSISERIGDYIINTAQSIHGARE
ncbi:MAG: Na/Pi cotransporter family protein [Bacteroidales bacterium]|nr:Na/Pi cotransporter family protein [Bacteroidales bacterium]